MCHAFGIKDQKCEYKNGFSDQKHTPRYLSHTFAKLGMGGIFPALDTGCMFCLEYL